MKDITKKYSNGEVTVVWKPNQCIHSTNCFHGLGEVFNPSIEQIKKCPSGALSYYMNTDEGKEEVKVEAETIVETVPNGPLMVYGNVSIKNNSGVVTKKNKVTAFCRCGASSNKPFCDGSHKKIDFQG